MAREDGADERGFLTRPISISKPTSMTDASWDILQEALENIYVTKANSVTKTVNILTFS